MAAGLRLERNDAHAQAVQSRHSSMARPRQQDEIPDWRRRPWLDLLVVGQALRVRRVDRTPELLEAGARLGRHAVEDRLAAFGRGVGRMRPSPTASCSGFSAAREWAPTAAYSSCVRSREIRGTTSCSSTARWCSSSFSSLIRVVCRDDRSSIPGLAIHAWAWAWAVGPSPASPRAARPSVSDEVRMLGRTLLQQRPHQHVLALVMCVQHRRHHHHVTPDHRGSIRVPLGDGLDRQRQAGELVPQAVMHGEHLGHVGVVVDGHGDS